LKTIPLKSPKAIVAWKKVCGQKCIEISAGTSGQFCSGFSRVGGNQCKLVGCNPGVLMGPVVPVKPKKNRPPPFAATLNMGCFVPIPTMSPTFPVPTKKPTPITYAPIPYCPASATNNALKLLEGRPTGATTFVKVEPNPNLCEYVRIAFTPGATFQVTNFACTVEACLRWCFADDGCLYSMWSPVDKICYKSNQLELTDDKSNYQPYFTGKYETYVKKSSNGGLIPYYSGKCNERIPINCNPDPEW
jgi:hypothetical protein